MTDVNNNHPDDVCIRCRVRRVPEGKNSDFGEMIPMICFLRKWKSSSPSKIWSLLESLSPSTPAHNRRSCITENQTSTPNLQHPLIESTKPSTKSRLPELVFHPTPSSSPHSKSSSRSSSLHSSRRRARTPRAHSHTQSLSTRNSDRHFTPEQALRRHKRVKSEGKREEDNWLEKIHLRSSSPDPTTRREESRSRRRRHVLTPNGSLRANALFSVSDNLMWSEEGEFREEVGEPFTITLKDILLVDKSPIKQMDPSILGSTLFITTEFQGYFELMFYSQHSQDVLLSFLCISLPSNCIRKGMKVHTLEENLVEQHDDMDNFEAKAVHRLFRNETFVERIRRRTTRIFSRFTEKLSECVCGPKSLDIHPSTDRQWLVNKKSNNHPHGNMINPELSVHEDPNNLSLINDDHTVASKLSLEIASLRN